MHRAAVCSLVPRMWQYRATSSTSVLIVVSGSVVVVFEACARMLAQGTLVVHEVTPSDNLLSSVVLCTGRAGQTVCTCLPTAHPIASVSGLAWRVQHTSAWPAVHGSFCPCPMHEHV